MTRSVAVVVCSDLASKAAEAGWRACRVPRYQPREETGMSSEAVSMTDQQIHDSG